jgi:uroporphyrinogen-III decarboxylase
MTSRERILAVLRGEEVDRFPVWLKMLGNDWRKAQPEPYRTMSPDKLLRQSGCDRMLGCGTPCRIERPHVSTRVTFHDHRRTTQYVTRDGTLVCVEQQDPVTESWHPVEYPVKNANDLRAFRWLFKDVRVHIESEKVEEARARQKELEGTHTVTTSGVGPSPLMSLVEHDAGPENAFYLMADERELFDETVELMHAARMTELRNRLPHEVADTFWLTENTSTTLISPALFDRYCVPQLREYGDLIIKHGRIAVHHMCGRLDKLLETIDTLPAQANEAYTTRPLGDLSLAEGRRRMPSKTLIGGTNATLWLDPVDKILETVAADIAACPDRRRIFLTSAGVLPPLVSFEKARSAVRGFREL